MKLPSVILGLGLTVTACMRPPVKPGFGFPGSANPGDGDSVAASDSDGSTDGSGTDADANGTTTGGSPADTQPGGIGTSTTVPKGIEWPADHSFPTFQAIRTLDLVSSKLLNNDNANMVMSLQGIVNRSEPRIYITGFNGNDKTWIAEWGAKTTDVSSISDLVMKYKSEIKGMVIYDDAQLDTTDLAITMAGVHDIIVVSPKDADTYKNAPFSLPVFADLRENKFKSALEVYQFEYDKYAQLATHRMIFGLDPGIRDHLRDYCVAVKGLMMHLNPGDGAAEKALLDKFLALMEPNSPYMGWWKDEGAGVHESGNFQVVTYASDFSPNLTVFGAKFPITAKLPNPPAAPKIENKIYISFYISDGDNLQEDQGLIPDKWSKDGRGSVPLAWTISPVLVDVAPVILNYLRKTATPQDVLVDGPSGAGYTYPEAWPQGTFNKYTKRSRLYMDRADLHIITLWNEKKDLNDEAKAAYAADLDNLQGMTIMDISREWQYLNDKIPIQSFSLSYGDTPEICEHGITDAIKRFDGSKPLFVTIQANNNHSEIQSASLAALAKKYESNSNIVFVRPDHYFDMVRQVKPK